MTSCGNDQAGDPMRQRNIVVVEKNHKLAARCGEAEIARAGNAEMGTAHDTKHLETRGGGVELVTIIDNDKLNVLVGLGAKRC